MEKIWLKEYPAGIPAEIDLSQYSSLKAMAEESFTRFASQNAYVLMDKTLTYADVDLMSARFGACSSRVLPRATVSPSCCPISCSTRL